MLSFLRNRTILVLLAISFITVILCGLLFFRNQDDGKWSAMSARVAELKQEARSRILPRSVLRGQPLPGNAWDEYHLALTGALAIKDVQNGALFAEFINDAPTADRARVVEALASHPGVLAHLRLGAQKSDGQYPYRWEDGTQMQLPSLLAIRLVAMIATSQAKISLESGRPKEAVDYMLDVFVFARDTAANGPLLTRLIGDSVYEIASNELRKIILSGKLSPTQLADLEKKLEIIERDLPSLGPTLANETLTSSVATMELSSFEPSTWWMLARNGGWRYGFSSQRMTLAAFEKRESYAQRTQNIDQMDFTTAKKETEAISAEADSSENPMLRAVALPSLPKTLMKQRETRARLQLLRAGAGFLATGKVPEVTDPFGTNLFHAQDGAKVKIWSVGSDGRNDNGSGGWTPGQPDMVLEITR
jgi:hypothetical protein